MKTKCTYLFLVAICISIFFTTCKKYAEDGKHSWHIPENRILGTWYLKEYIVDGDDSTNNSYEINNALNGIIKWKMFDARFNFTNYTHKDYQNTVGQVIYIYLKNVTLDSSSGCPSCYLHTSVDWALKDKKTIVSFNTTDNYLNLDTVQTSYSILATVKNDNWIIEKLTDTELILEANSNNNKHLRLKFQK